MTRPALVHAGPMWNGVTRPNSRGNAHRQKGSRAGPAFEGYTANSLTKIAANKIKNTRIPHLPSSLPASFTASETKLSALRVNQPRSFLEARLFGFGATADFSINESEKPSRISICVRFWREGQRTARPAQRSWSNLLFPKRKRANVPL